MNKRIRFSTIAAAKEGNSQAMGEILSFFKPFILHCSKRQYIDESGMKVEYIDPEIKERIEEKLMLAIIFHFDLSKLPDGETLDE